MAKEEALSGIIDVDQTVNPTSWVQYLDTASAVEAVQAMKRRSFAQLDVQAGRHLLDVGCGPGDDVRTLAQLVGSAGRVVGVDSSETMVTEARQRARDASLSVEYFVSDAQQLHFAENTFDGCRAERVLVHVENPRQALAEMIRVARPGARVVVLDPDFETLVIDAEDRAVTRKLLNFVCDGRIRNGWLGRQLPRLFKEAKLSDIAIFAETLMFTEYAVAEPLLRLHEGVQQAQAAGVLTSAEGSAWETHLESASQVGQFFAAMTFFCVSGRKG
jgi:ubiquinone/menaquinone biosynthesis C-methylase UbiE